MTSIGLSPQQLKELEVFVSFLKQNPDTLHSKELRFLKEYLESLGANIPQAKTKVEQPHEEKKEPQKKESKAEDGEGLEEEKQEPDPEIVSPDNDPPLETGDESKEVTDDQRDEATNLKIEALDAQREGKLEDALNLLTKAIKVNPHAGILYASRAQLLLEMKKPNAAIRDCNTAIKIAPDSAKGYKIRGRANRLLGNYETALRDYQQGQKLDFDENTKKLEDEIKPRAESLITKRARLEREKRENEAKEREELRKQRRQQQQQEQQAPPPPDFGGFPGMGGMGGFPGMGGMGGITPEILNAIMSDPDMLEAMQDPTFLSKLQDVQSNPANLAKYQNDPVVQRLAKKFSTMFGGAAEPTADFDDAVPTADDVD